MKHYRLMATVAIALGLALSATAADAKFVEKKAATSFARDSTSVSHKDYTKKGVKQNMAGEKNDAKKLVGKHTTFNGRQSAVDGMVKHVAPYVPDPYSMGANGAMVAGHEIAGAIRHPGVTKHNALAQAHEIKQTAKVAGHEIKHNAVAQEHAVKHTALAQVHANTKIKLKR